MSRCRAVQIFVGASLIAGCHHENAAPPGPLEETRVDWKSKPIVGPATRQVTPVKEGMPPLAYMVETPGMVRVVDLTTNSVVIETSAAARALVVIPETPGGQISVGEERVRGHIDQTHRFGIYVESSAENQIRQGTVIRSGEEKSQPQTGHR